MRSKTALLTALMLALVGFVTQRASAQSFDYQFSTNGKQYALAYVHATQPKLVRPDWKDVTWSLGPAFGAEVSGPMVFGPMAKIEAYDHNTKAFVAIDLAGLIPFASKPIGVLGLSFGFKVPVN